MVEGGEERDKPGGCKAQRRNPNGNDKRDKDDQDDDEEKPKRHSVCLVTMSMSYCSKSDNKKYPRG